MDCLVVTFVDEFSNFFNILLVLGRPEYSSSSADIQLALKHECQSETTVQLKECSPKASRSISRFLMADLLSFTQDADMLLNFAIHGRQNKTQS
jgi:hypothetical protein